MTLEEARQNGIAVLDDPPEGWIRQPDGGTAPDGYHWWSSGSLFSPGFECALVRVKQCGNCKWLRVQDPDYALMCYCGGGKYSFKEIDAETAWVLECTCEKWEEKA